jgi:hypothetical protein
MSEENRPAWLLPTGIGLLVLVLVVVALLREPVQLDPGTPDGTVQEYLQAISDDDFETAFELLHPDEFDGCVPSDIQRHLGDQPFTASLESDVEPMDDRDLTIVNVRIRFGTEGPFGSGWETFESFELVSEDGMWWITGEPWPHFFFACRERGDI